MQACYLRAFLPKLSAWNAERVKLCALYDRLLAGCEAFQPLARRAGLVCHLSVARAARRDRRGDFPVAERACREIVSLPLWPGMRRRMVEEVAARAREFYQP